ncbi:hypothetical protein [Pedobacter sp. NJ-S-72]
MPLGVVGVINNVIAIPGSEDLLKLVISSYKQIDGTSVDPTLAREDFFRFSNSLLSTPAGQFRIHSIEAGSQWPVITIERIAHVEVIDDAEDQGVYGTQKSYTSPEIGSRFTITENLSNPENWKPIESQISLKSFADIDNPKLERLIDSEGNPTTYWVGGLHNNATVSPLFGHANDADNLLGYYRISFDGEGVLAPHPQINLPFDPSNANKNSPDQIRQAHVEWYKGWVRIPVLSGDKDLKQLQVLRIEQTNPVVLYVYDPTYTEDPILTSNSPEVRVPLNFHPGYRAYLFPETVVNHTFNGANILPADEANDRKTLLGLQAADTRPDNGAFVSRISVPAVLLARKIEEPVQFEVPNAAGLKVRPDATAKAAFTFDVKISPSKNGKLRNPFGFLFYRTTSEDILDALYSPVTVNQIFADLGKLTKDSYYNQRYLELANLIFDPVQPGAFRIFEASPTPYGFPLPDKNDLTEAGDSLALKKVKYTDAIHQTLLPLTEQPVIFTYLKQGFQTENKVPVIRNLDGQLLSSSNPDFNPFPMVRKYRLDKEPNTTYIRFTDYFLSGASRKLYFFAGTELTNQLEPGLISPFAGPVEILQTLASAPPLVTGTSINLDTVLVESGASITFKIAPLSPVSHISKIRIYRTTHESDALSLHTMDSHFDQKLEIDQPLGYELTDSFENLTSVPLGQTIYYRLVGIRTIINEKEEVEDVLSLPTAVIAIKLADNRNPDAPDLNYNDAENKLSWKATANNSTYYVYKQNKQGNWERVYTVEPPKSELKMEYALPASLVPLDENGDKLYYRFKVQVQNSSGLFNITDKEITI